jgi:hypothetical protein
MSCKRYASCDEVPCDEVMTGCRPAYCYEPTNRSLSKNWGECNMRGKECHKGERCQKAVPMSKKKRSTMRRRMVDAVVLHKKMPYIGRH